MRVAEIDVETRPGVDLHAQFGEHQGLHGHEGGARCVFAEEVAPLKPRAIPERPVALRLSGLEPFELVA